MVDDGVSRADREKWEQRYREGAYLTRKHPSALLEQWLPRLEITEAQPRAIDVACGRGRNAIYLARHGWRVDAVDISQLALDALAETAMTGDLSITCNRADLDGTVSLPAGLFSPGRYDLAIMVRYMNLPLIETLKDTLKPGGYLIVEEHMDAEAEVIGPQDRQYRVRPGALRDTAGGLDIIEYQEGLVTDPDGRSAALAQMVARKPR